MCTVWLARLKGQTWKLKVVSKLTVGVGVERGGLFGKGLVDLLHGLLFGDAVGLGDLVGEGVLVSCDGRKVGRGELVEGGTELRLGRVVSHVGGGCGRVVGEEEF